MRFMLYNLCRDTNQEFAFVETALLMKYYGPCDECKENRPLLYGLWLNREAHGAPDAILCNEHLWVKKKGQ